MTMLTRTLVRYGLCAAGALVLCLFMPLHGGYLLSGTAAVSLCLYSGKALFRFMGELLGSAGNTAFMCLLFRSWIGLFVLLLLLIPILTAAFAAAVLVGLCLLVRDLWQGFHTPRGGGAGSIDLWAP